MSSGRLDPGRPVAPTAGYLPWWLVVGSGAACLAAAGLLAAFAVLTRTADLPQPTAPARVVTAPPGLGSGPTPSAAAPTAPPAEPATATVPPPPAGDVRVGGYVQVTGTGEDGFLNLRAEASLASPVNYLAIEREVLQVQAGPVSADGFTWWYLVDPASSTRFGWGVQNYLQSVPGP